MLNSAFFRQGQEIFGGGDDSFDKNLTNEEEPNHHQLINGSPVSSLETQIQGTFCPQLASTPPYSYNFFIDGGRDAAELSVSTANYVQTERISENACRPENMFANYTDQFAEYGGPTTKINLKCCDVSHGNASNDNCESANDYKDGSNSFEKQTPNFFREFLCIDGGQNLLQSEVDDDVGQQKTAKLRNSKNYNAEAFKLHKKQLSTPGLITPPSKIRSKMHDLALRNQLITSQVNQPQNF